MKANSSSLVETLLISPWSLGRRSASGRSGDGCGHGRDGCGLAFGMVSKRRAASAMFAMVRGSGTGRKGVGVGFVLVLLADVDTASIRAACGMVMTT